MIPHATEGSGMKGLFEYLMGEGNDPITERRRTLEPGATSRATILGGQNLGFEVNSPERLATALRMMEYGALPQNQASRTYKCTNDVLHISLSWGPGQKPSRKEAIAAAQEALQALDMAGARAVFIMHDRHIHIAASRINPDTRMTFSVKMALTKLHRWALDWERKSGHIPEARQQLHGIVDAIRAGDFGTMIAKLTERESVFSDYDLTKMMCYAGLDADQRTEFRARVMGHQDIVPLRETAAQPVTHYTTRQILAAERRALADAGRLAGAGGYALSPSTIEAVSEKYTLDPEQRAALEHAAGHGGFAMINGQAGAGKSRVLEALRAGYEAEGWTVIGTAWTNQVVNDMRRHNGFKNANTLASEFYRMDNESYFWGDRTIIIADETAMLSTTAAARMLKEAAAGGAKTILAGDPRQYGSIDRGGMFEALEQRHGSASISKIKRTKDEDYQRAFSAMYEGDFKSALKVFEKKDAIKWTKNNEQAVQALTARYFEDAQARPNKVRFVFAYTNELVDELNQSIRAFHRGRGDLGQDHTIKTAAGERPFAVGDRVQITENGNKKQKLAGLINGAVGTIREIDTSAEKPRIVVELDREPRKPAPRLELKIGEDRKAGEFNGLRHGYASSIYKSQGRTLDETYLLYSKHWRAATSYVALTRHREACTLFAAENNFTKLPKGADRNTVLIDKLAKQMQRKERKRAASAYHIDESTLRYVMDQERSNDNRARPTASAEPPTHKSALSSVISDLAETNKLPDVIDNYLARLQAEREAYQKQMDKERHAKDAGAQRRDAKPPQPELWRDISKKSERKVGQENARTQARRVAIAKSTARTVAKGAVSGTANAVRGAASVFGRLGSGLGPALDGAARLVESLAKSHEAFEQEKATQKEIDKIAPPPTKQELRDAAHSERYRLDKEKIDKERQEFLRKYGKEWVDERENEQDLSQSRERSR
jgi:hypothetical protein